MTAINILIMAFIYFYAIFLHFYVSFVRFPVVPNYSIHTQNS